VTGRTEGLAPRRRDGVDGALQPVVQVRPVAQLVGRDRDLLRTEPGGGCLLTTAGDDLRQDGGIGRRAACPRVPPNRFRGAASTASNGSAGWFAACPLPDSCCIKADITAGAVHAPLCQSAQRTGPLLLDRRRPPRRSGSAWLTNGCINRQWTRVPSQSHGFAKSDMSNAPRPMQFQKGGGEPSRNIKLAGRPLPLLVRHQLSGPQLIRWDVTSEQDRSHNGRRRWGGASDGR
jgi:hypothetical protein